MTRFRFFLFASIVGLFAHDGARGQTTINVSQISCAASAQPQVIVVLANLPGQPKARAVCAVIDTKTLVLDTSTNPPTLRTVAQAITFVNGETPAGAIDGNNQVFTIAFAPVAGSVKVFLNGLLQQSGATADYSIDGQKVTFASAPQVGDTVSVYYQR